MAYHLSQGSRQGPPDIRPGNPVSWRDRGHPAHARVFTASLASTHSMQVAPQPVLTTKTVSRHGSVSPRGNVVPRWRTTALDEFHAARVTAASPGPSTVPATWQGLDEDLLRECLEKSWEGHTKARPCRGPTGWVQQARVCTQTSCSGPGFPQVLPANGLAW